MVKLIGNMNSTNVKIKPVPPSLMKSLMAGFDAISNHVGLLFFTLSFDIFLWFGPRLRLAGLFESTFDREIELSDVSNTEVLKIFESFSQDFNLFSVLRTFPIGIPSLMAVRSPQITPFGVPTSWEVRSIGAAFGFWVFFTIIGAIVGAFYFMAVAQAAYDRNVRWKVTFRRWPWTSAQTLLLTAFWLALIFSAFTLLGCALSFLLIGSGIGLEQLSLILLLVFVGIMIWVLIPLLFSPHGLFFERSKMWASVVKGARLTRMTLPTTALLFLTIFIISEGLRLLWNIPPDDSWLSLVGIIGHAFVTSSLLAASFIYYRDADRWLRDVVKQAQSQPVI